MLCHLRFQAGYRASFFTGSAVTEIGELESTTSGIIHSVLLEDVRAHGDRKHPFWTKVE